MPQRTKETLGFNHYCQRTGVSLDTTGIARVVAEHRTEYTIVDTEEVQAVVRGTFHRDESFPKVGDWVRYSPTEGGAVIEEILPRYTTLARKENAASAPQILATNVDIMCIVQDMAHDFNMRRLERYALLAAHSGCTPVIVLSKADLVKNPEEKKKEVETTIPSATVLCIDTRNTKDIAALTQAIPVGQTGVLLGMSGAGKSTLLNTLTHAETMEIGAVRDYDGKGRHTTTHRELFVMPHGGLIIDTPGMRELGLLPSDTDQDDRIYAHFTELITQCRFPNCDHEKSVGCAIQTAITNDEIEEKQWNAYQRIVKERAYEAQRIVPQVSPEAKTIHKEQIKIQKQKYRSQEELES